MAGPVARGTHEVRTTERTTCCVVGGGPAGLVLALLLARQDIPVLLLESHQDFDRDFRGDTLHPSILEVMDELGLADRLLQLPHTKVQQMAAPSFTSPMVLADLSRLRTKFPFMALMPQAHFLAFLAGEARRFPSFGLRLGARVEELVEEDGAVRGVRYHAADGWHEVRAALVVGADGRFSRLRRLAGFAAVKSSPPMDVLWFRLPRRPDDPHGVMGRFGHGHLLVELDRGDEWQLGFIIAKGTYQQVRAAGLEALRDAVVELAPEFADRVGALREWQQVAVLSVEADRLPRWYKPGLLLIGDAAHTMSPAGGNGINYAVMDAVATANILAGPLRAGQVTVRDLARVQRRRELPTRLIQAIVTVLQDRLLAAALDPQASLALPGFFRWPLVRELPPRLFGYGILPEHVRPGAGRSRAAPPAWAWLAGAVLVLAAGRALRRLIARHRHGA
jgi:2-polyprenyl-6-methoxyphenol hydroxylase-like FAD-dependent oxidoreductase